MDISRYEEIGKFANKELSRVGMGILQFYSKSSRGKRISKKFISQWMGNFVKRAKYEDQGIYIPPWLMASINFKCNLRCTGCYARAIEACGEGSFPEELTCEDWDRIFAEASELGIAVVHILGGEPFMRTEVLEIAAKYTNIIFLIFTNGTLIDAQFMDKYPNLVPLISIEGDSAATDERRGKGVAKRQDEIMESLRVNDIFFGISITATTVNLKQVTDPVFINSLREKGCGYVYYVEYIPKEEGTEALALNKEENARLAIAVKSLNEQFDDMYIYAFQGFEANLGGCVGAGRVFFHISASGGAEPCPFSPYSGVNMRDHTILEALESRFLCEVRDLIENGKEENGCTLHIRRHELDEMQTRDQSKKPTLIEG